MIKNESVLGIQEFLKRFYKDVKSGKATGWWNERFSRKSEILNLNSKIKTVYDLVEFIKVNSDSLSDEAIDNFCQAVLKTYPALDRKRSYFWEVDLTVETEDVEPETAPEVEEKQEEEIVESDPNAPDFDYAKGLDPDKQALREYAKSFGFELDARKAFKNMMKTFQGKYHATKNKK